MAQETLVFLSGILLFITPFLGIPAQWKLYIYVGLGALLLVIGYRLRYERFLRSLEDENGELRGETFVEATPALFSKDKDRSS